MGATVVEAHGDMPGVLSVQGELLRDNAMFQMSLSDVTGLGKCLEFWLYGSDLTIHLDIVKQTVRVGARNDTELRDATAEIATGQGWNVEADFVDSIRNGSKVRLTDFATGVQYMEFTDAVWQSLKYKLSVTIWMHARTIKKNEYLF